MAPGTVTQRPSAPWATARARPRAADEPDTGDWHAIGAAPRIEQAGQLGHVAYRHRELECWFDTPADRERFAALWQRYVGKTPEFARADTGA